MNKKLELFIGFALLFLIGIGFWYGLKSIFQYFRSTDSKLVATIITAFATLLVGVIVALISHNRIKNREIEEAHRESKIELYTRFNEFLVRVLLGSDKSKIGSKPSDEEMTEFMTEFKRDLIFRASPEVIKAMLIYTKNRDNKKVIKCMHDLLLAMRRDIGLKNTRMDNFELIQIFLKDPEDINKLK